MNVNEVVANHALDLLDRPRGAYESLHPLEHVNRGSTNDVYPTAIKLALDSHIQALLGALATLRGDDRRGRAAAPLAGLHGKPV